MSQMWTHRQTDRQTDRQTEKDVNPTSRYSTGFSKIPKNIGFILILGKEIVLTIKNRSEQYLWLNMAEQ